MVSAIIGTSVASLAITQCVRMQKRGPVAIIQDAIVLKRITETLGQYGRDIFCEIAVKRSESYAKAPATAATRPTAIITRSPGTLAAALKWTLVDEREPADEAAAVAVAVAVAEDTVAAEEAEAD